MLFMRFVLTIAIVACSVSVYAGELKTIVVISIDALHPDALSGKTSPAIFRLMNEGRYTLKGKSVEPPKTLIAHTSMMTGLPPAENGKTDNEWKPGDKRVGKETLFDDAKRAGFHTAFFFSKTKLGYLVNGAVNEHALAPDDGIARTGVVIERQGRKFVFLHISGLEYEGMENGWLSKAYLQELSSIDGRLAPLFSDVKNRGGYLIIVTSDHGGHDRLHGTNHPDDYKLPFIIVSDRIAYPDIHDKPYSVTQLKAILKKIGNGK